MLPPESFLLMLHVSSFHTNTPHVGGIVACEEALNSTVSPVPPTADLCHLMWLISSMNSFTCNQRYYLEIQSSAMGTHMDPSYASLVMGKLEQEFLQTQNVKLWVWWRYIDDIFAIWTHGEPSLRTFLGNLNHHHPAIKYTVSWSAKEVMFLVARVYLKMAGSRLTCMLNPQTRTSTFAWIVPPKTLQNRYALESNTMPPKDLLRGRKFP